MLWRAVAYESFAFNGLPPEELCRLLPPVTILRLCLGPISELLTASIVLWIGFTFLPVNLELFRDFLTVEVTFLLETLVVAY